MEKYKVIKQLGGGTFGTVCQAKNSQTGEVVAIKELKQPYQSWSRCIELQEVKSLAKLNHPNIVKLLEVIKQNNKLFLVFEYMDQNILQLLKSKLEKRTVNEIEVRNIIFQVLQGIYFMHRNGYFHRDLKPENILEFKQTIKIADFGLVKSISATRPLTEYVSTRWYRAPELVLNSTSYDEKVDIFAIGAIMAELYNGKGLFEGANQLDQLNKLFVALGTPTPLDWEEGYRLAKKIGCQFTQHKKQNLQTLVPGANSEAIDLMNKMFSFDPKKRISALEALQHPYFMVDVPLPVEQQHKPTIQSDSLKQTGFNPIKPVQISNTPVNAMAENVKQDQKQVGQQQSSKALTKYYLTKARYKPGVNIASLLSAANNQ